MLQFILRRLGLVIPTFIGITLLTFAFVHMIPGDPVMIMAGERGISPERHAQLLAELGLDKPMWQQYLHYIWGVMHGDLGISMKSRIPVWEEFVPRFQATLELGVCAMIFATAVGIPVGVLAAVKRGSIFDHTAVGLALPSLLLALVLVAIFGPSIGNAALALTFVALPHYVRLTRAAVLVEVNRDYVTASRVAGAGAMRQMFINIFPNCLAPLIVQASLGFSNAILDMAALGFLGMGAQPPTPEWGTMLSDVLQFAQSAWWVVTFPGLAILLTVLAFNLMGDGLRDALDPKLKQ